MLFKTVVVITGLPTSGKTVLGKAISKETGLHFLDIDAGPALCAAPQEANPLATDESAARERLRMGIAYEVLHAAIEAHFKRDMSLIVCATYSRNTSQDFLKAAVDRGGGAMKIITCCYDDTPEEVARRIQLRVSSGAMGGCRSSEHYFRDKARFEASKLPHLTVKMNGGDQGVAQAVAEAIQYINS